MIPVPGFEGRKVGILGLARSGVATARAVRAGGGEPVVWDDREAARDEARAEGFTLCDFARDDWPELETLVVSPGVPHLYPQPHPAVARAWGEGVPVDNDIGLFFRALEGTGIRSVAITGTNGKSTTAALIGHVLETAGRDVRVGGNIGKAVFDLEPVTEGGAVVLELSSYQIDVARRLSPDVAIFLNLAPDHLDRHGGFGGYFAAKKRLFETHVPGVSVIGVDEPEGRFLANRLRAGREPGDALIAISGTRRLGGRGRSVAFRGGKIVELRDGREIALADLAGARGLRGVHNRQNAAAAFAAARVFGIDGATVEKAFRDFPGLAHRMEEVGRLGHVIFVNDSKATNAEAAAQALSTFDDIHWIAGGRAKEGGVAGLKPFFPKIRHAYLVGESAKVLAAELEGVVTYSISGTIDQAVQEAAKRAAEDPGAEPVVLLSPACASFDQFPDFEARGQAFVAAARTVPGFAPRRPVG